MAYKKTTQPREGFGGLFWLRIDSVLAPNDSISLLVAFGSFFGHTLPLPTFSLLTGQRANFQQLADYHARRAASLRMEIGLKIQFKKQHPADLRYLH